MLCLEKSIVRFDSCDPTPSAGVTRGKGDTTHYVLAQQLEL